MSKSKIVLLIVITIAIIASIVAAQQLNKHSITINPSGSDIPTTLYEGSSNGEKQIAQFSTKSTLSLQDGYYCLVANDKKYSAAEQCFTVYKKDKTIDFKPSYSGEYLASLLTEAEQAAITSSLQARYSQPLTGFNTTNGALVDDGTWFVGSLTQKTAQPSEQGDVYKYILHKTDGTWQVTAKPQLVISSSEHPDIPKLIVDTANNL